MPTKGDSILSATTFITKVVQVQDVFFNELNALSDTWGSVGVKTVDVVEENAWLLFADLCMSLDTRAVVSVESIVAAVAVPLIEGDGAGGSLRSPRGRFRLKTRRWALASTQAAVSADEASIPTVSEANNISSVGALRLPPPVSSSVPVPPASEEQSQPSFESAPTKPAALAPTSSEPPVVKRQGRKSKLIPKKLGLITDGPDAVHHCMVG